MKDELQSKLVEVLTSIQNASAQAADFTMEQLPDIAQSYVAFGLVSSIIWAVACLVAFVAFWSLIIKGEEEGCHDGFLYVFGGLFSLFPLVFGLLNLQSAILAWYAPKVWLLKEIASMVGK